MDLRKQILCNQQCRANVSPLSLRQVLSGPNKHRNLFLDHSEFRDEIPERSCYESTHSRELISEDQLFLLQSATFRIDNGKQYHAKTISQSE